MYELLFIIRSYSSMYVRIYVACRVPRTNMDAIIRIDANLDGAGEVAWKAAMALATKYEYRTSLSLVRAGNKTFLETRYSRSYAAEDVNGTGYDQLEILAKSYSPDYDYLMTRRAFIIFVTSQHAFRNNLTETTEEVDDILEMCDAPSEGSWSVKLHTSELSSTEYTPLQLPVSEFLVAVHFMQDCTRISKKCENVQDALE